MRRLIDCLPAVILAWGVLAFGAVYPWAYVPLTIAALISGTCELWRCRAHLRSNPVPLVSAGLGLVAAAVAIQLVPLSRTILDAVSPSAGQFLARYSLGFSDAGAGVALHPLSVDPRQTLLGLMFVAAFGVFLIGLLVRVADRGARDLVGMVTVLGVIVSLVAIVQRATGVNSVYGFWQPEFQTTPYGPFINRNHFAGWVMMALPLVIGRGWAHVQRNGARPGWRNRLIWLGSPAASRSLLTSFIGIVMALSLILSTSRSGATALILTMALLVAFVWFGAGRSKGWLVAYTVVFTAIVFGWGMTEDLSARLASARHDLEGRTAIWRDARQVAADFRWTGSGLNTYGTTMLFYQRTDLDRHYAEAHNDYLQLAAEGGVLLCVPAFLFLLAVACGALTGLKATAWDATRAGAVVGLIAVLLQEAGDFSLQIPGNVVLFCTLCAIAAAPVHKVRRADCPERV